MNSQSKLTVRSSLLKMSLRRYPGWGKSWLRSRLRFRRLRGSTRSFLSRNLKAFTAALQSKRREVLLKTWISWSLSMRWNRLRMFSLTSARSKWFVTFFWLKIYCLHVWWVNII
jgi:hypothetical protein